MVYSAMKLFMEINPTLFDECTTEYAAIQENLPQRQAERENVWKLLEEQAEQKRKQLEATKTNNSTTQGRSGSPMQISDEKMNDLRIKDDKKAVGYA